MKNISSFLKATVASLLLVACVFTSSAATITNNVTISWNPTIGGSTNSGPFGYVVYNRNVANGPGYVVVGGGQATNYTQAVVSGTTNFWYISATNAWGESLPSNTVELQAIPPYPPGTNGWQLKITGTADLFKKGVLYASKDGVDWKKQYNWEKPKSIYVSLALSN